MRLRRNPAGGFDKTFTLYGIVTHGEGWKFYQLQPSGAVAE